MKIEILGTGCPKCKATEGKLRKVETKIGLKAVTRKIENKLKLINYNSNEVKT